MLEDFLHITRKIGGSLQDTDQQKNLKGNLILLSVLTGITGIIWASMYVLFDLFSTALYPVLYTVCMTVSLIYFHFKKNFFLLLYTNLILLLILPFVVQWSLGGFAASGSVMIWGILTPIGSLLFQGVRSAVLWFFAYIILMMLAISFDEQMHQNITKLPFWVAKLFLAMNLSFFTSITFFSTLYYITAKNKEQAKNTALLQHALDAEEELERKNVLLEKALEERNILLKEIHHRVKNNMQVITSLLSLQSNYVSDEQMKGLLRYSQYRIRSMAIIHEMLYQSKDLSKILYSDYLTLLTSHLLQSMKGSDSKIKVEIDAEDIILNIDTAIPLGLMINEIVTNALKYGFPGDQNGTLSIRIQKNKTPHYILYIGDDGVGFPDDVNFRQSSSLGILLMHNLALQLKGNIEKEKKKGTHYMISFQEIIQTS